MKPALRVFVCAALFTFCTCTRDYNPFLDASNARVIAKKTGIANKSSIQIFSTETLTVAVAARDMVDSFSVSSPKNRFFIDTVIYNKNISPMSAYYSFFISVFDTGFDTISFETYKKNGDVSIAEQIVVYCTSPLNQNTVQGNFGLPLELKTPRVADNDVKYHWDFTGLNNSFASGDSVDSITILESGVVDTSLTGELYVTDKSGKFRSPARLFRYQLTDSISPVIVNYNAGFMNTDTIKTSDSTFLFKVQIFDPGQSIPVSSATINGAPFDRVVNGVYIKAIYGMDTVKTAVLLQVRVMDNPVSKNVAVKDFYIVYTSGVAHSGATTITVLSPTLDASNRATVGITPKSIFGSIVDYSGDSLNLAVYLWVNGKKLPKPFMAKGQGQAYWSFDVDLVQGVDTIRISAYKNPIGSSDSVAAALCYIAYDPSLVIADSVAPKILDVSAFTLSGETVTNDISDKDSAIIRVIAIDEATYVDTLKINNSVIQSGQTGVQYIWFDTLKIRHRAKGDTVKVLAIDKSDNKSSSAITVIYNRLPQVTRQPAPPAQLLAGKNYTDFISAIDPDSDVVSFSKKSGPIALTVTSGGIITWTPQASDTVQPAYVTIGVSDGIQETSYQYSMIVVPSPENTPAVRFEPILINVPQYLVAGRDSILTTFHIKSGSGKPPFSFKALNVALTMKDSVFNWKPALADTGVHKPVIIVTDQLLTSDTLYMPSVLVVPQNRSFTLNIAPPAVRNGLLDLSGQTGPDTLKFSIADPDTFIADKHMVSITQSQTRTIYSLDSSQTFLVVLDPSKVNKSGFSGVRDTISVSVSDLANHRDSLRVFVVYSYPVLSKKISFNTTAQNSGAGITSNVTNFRALIRLDKSVFDFSVVNKIGQNIYFRKAGGGFLPFEIDTWDSANGNAAVWVLIDTVYANATSQFISMAWNSDTGALQSSSGPNVFKTSDNYLGVWHLSEGGSVHRINSVSPSLYPLIPVGFNGSESISGLIGKSDVLGGTLSEHDSLASIVLGPVFSLSVWVSPAQLLGGGIIFVSPGSNGTGSISLAEDTFSAGGTPNAVFKLHYTTSLGSSAFGTIKSKSKLQINQWSNIIAVYSGSQIGLYFNGILEDSAAISGDAGLTGSVPFLFGYDPSNPSARFTGAIDEVRFNKGPVPSLDWAKISYLNQKPNQTGIGFITIK
jgi:hypothetical protein